MAEVLNLLKSEYFASFISKVLTPYNPRFPASISINAGK